MEKFWNLLWKNEVFGSFWVESGDLRGKFCGKVAWNAGDKFGFLVEKCWGVEVGNK